MTDEPLDVAVRVLRHHDRSRAQVAARLERAGMDEDRTRETLSRLERLGYVDDARFASGRAAALAARSFGDAAIRHDLEAGGVGAEEVEAALAALEPELERATRVVTRRGRSARTASYLGRKGFGADAIEGAVGTLDAPRP